MNPWKVLGSHYLLKGPWLNVRSDRVATSRGVELDEFLVIESRSWVCVVCLTATGEVVLVEQYRHGIRRGTVELPAGAIDNGETPAQAAARELREETGYESSRWESLGSFSPEPTRHDHRVHLFAALEAKQTASQQLDDTEDVAVRLATPVELGRLVDTGTLVHAVHVSAVLLAQRRGLLTLP